MSPVLAAYGMYLVIGVALTLWVGRALTHGVQAFLLDVLSGRAELGEAVGRLLGVGFYLLSFGYIALTMPDGRGVFDARSAVQSVSGRIGGVLLVLGAVHLANVYVLSRIRRRKLAEQQWQQWQQWQQSADAYAAADPTVGGPVAGPVGPGAARR